jgi:hypothetical protein
MTRALAVVLAIFCAGVIVSADTLFLLDGSRIEGRVLSVRDDVVEFEERGTRRRVVRHRDEVARIEFNNGRIERPDRPERPSFGGGGGNVDPGTGRPQGMLRRDVEVRGREPFTDTGIRVRSGQLIYIEASGEVRWGRGREDGPAGENDSPINNGRPIPASPAAALIGRVGDDNRDLFFIGAEPGPFRMRASGSLHLGINDDTFNDNSGSFRVVIYY